MISKNALIVLIIVAVVVSFYCILSKGNWSKSTAPTPLQVGCTMEAKLCPDGSYVGRSGPSCAFANCPGPAQTDSENIAQKSFTDSASGITFSYPEKLSAQYISTVDWPPKVELINEFFVCNEAGQETSPAGKTEKVTINGRQYCRTIVSEGAAGSTYTQFAYAFADDDNTLILNFTLRFVQCDNFEGPAVAACKTERESFDINSIVDKIAQSVKF